MKHAGHADGSPQAVAARERSTLNHRWNTAISARRMADDLQARASILPPTHAAPILATSERWAKRATELETKHVVETYPTSRSASLPMRQDIIAALTSKDKTP